MSVQGAVEHWSLKGNLSASMTVMWEWPADYMLNWFSPSTASGFEIGLSRAPTAWAVSPAAPKPRKTLHSNALHPSFPTQSLVTPSMEGVLQWLHPSLKSFYSYCSSTLSVWPASYYFSLHSSFSWSVATITAVVSTAVFAANVALVVGVKNNVNSLFPGCDFACESTPKTKGAQISYI
ncbi:uncharacterized protein HD556DRAFT_1313322 [Suillus plorans]|uniref:Transmembrane protein n=1 Tax=Suillus plorans TaxID=116603 RepID=A0A9P7DCD8_9AGAM|nr:uncharacterized protein HD556DRAFT_1313322 [Suillus plorans]KAG1786699.1 hypothetical protein HD556DRAFT_1313322 [Suillus plorans]